MPARPPTLADRVHLRADQLQLHPPLTPAYWMARTETERFSAFLAHVCLLNEGMVCELGALVRAYRAFLAANSVPALLRMPVARPLVKQLLAHFGYTVSIVDGKQQVEDLAIRGGPLSLQEFYATFPNARKAHRRHVRDAARTQQPVDWRYWDSGAHYRQFLREACVHQDGVRLPLRWLKRVYQAWHSQVLPRIPHGSRGAVRTFGPTFLPTILEEEGYRLVRTDNRPVIKGLQLTPHWDQWYRSTFPTDPLL